MADSFLSQAELEAVIEKVSRTREGKAAIRSAIGKKNAKFVARFDDGSSKAKADRGKMNLKAEEMKEILFRHLTADTQTDGRRGLADFPKDAIIIGKQVAIGNTGDYRIDISFDADSLRRQSLSPDAYPEGITDIISLFVHGYNAKGSVVGSWHGEDNVWSLRHRDSNDFMARAVEEFNDNNNGDGFVQAILMDKYK